MQQFNVTGMSCAACSARVEKAVKPVVGVESCSVNLLTNTLTVEGTASEKDIIAAVKKAGYGIKTQKEEKNSAENTDDRETVRLVRRLIVSLVLSALLMYIAMGHMLSLPQIAFIEENAVLNAILQMIIAAVVMVINRKFFVNGFKGIMNKAPNMDTLVALGSGASFLWSIAVLVMLVNAQRLGDMTEVMELRHNLYFESAAMILALITLGKMLENKSKGKTTTALKALMDLKPKTARLFRNGEEVTVNVSEVKKGDIFILKPGDSVPVDGVVTEGESAINESSLTGESIPVDKSVGDRVSAATINQSGYLKCEAVAVGEDTTISQIIKMVSDAAAGKAPIAKAADKVAGVFVPAVMVIAVITCVVWLLCGAELGFALARGISVLVISCPCALGLATPVAIMVGNGVGAKSGILFKTAEAIEKAGRIKIVALDKTGTVTKGEPEVTDMLTCGRFGERELLDIAVGLEAKSEHPLAKAVVAYGEEKAVEACGVSDFEAVTGKGLKGKLNGKDVYGGNYSYISCFCNVADEIREKADAFSKQGKTVLYFACGYELAGIIAVADTVKESSRRAVARLHKMGIETVMLTGDNEDTASEIAKQVGIDKVIAGVLPDGKERVIRELKGKNPVAMVGDGINDAPALTGADLGVAIGAGTDIAVDAADVVLVRNDLESVCDMIHIGRKTLRNIHENLFWAFIYNVIGIPLAAGVWIPLFGWELNPMFGAAAMSLSSFCVVMNALRLNMIGGPRAKGPRVEHR
ncbi:MAG: copper-translocating P-type ATPase [Clostridia bacterium]|nr:copper-translocating P-type ATPase [Clostridia bacterium]